MSDRYRATFYLGLGLLSASALGIVSYFLVDLRRDLELSPVLEGFAVSLITLVGAAFGFLIGAAMRQISLGRALCAGLVVLGASSLVAALADGVSAFLLSRLAAGVGFTVLVIALPVAITLVEDAKPRRAALMMWGSFLPLGIAFGTGLAATGTSDWRLAFASHGALCLTAAGVALRLDACRSIPSEIGANPFTLLRDGVAMSFAGGFAAFAAIFLIVVVLLPGYLRTTTNLGAAHAGVLAAFVCATSTLTSLALAWLRPRLSCFFLIFAIGFAGSALAGSVFFLAADQPAVGVGAVIAVIVLSALVPSGVFASLTLVVPEHDVGQLSGLVAQMGSLGSLVGPPLTTWWTAEFGWSTGWIPFCLICLFGTALFLQPSRRITAAA